MAPDELADLGADIVRRAGEQGMDLRMFGGVAVYARCPGIAGHPKLQRTYKDLDLVAPKRAWNGLADLFASMGFNAQDAEKDRASFIRDGVSVDVRPSDFRDCFAFSLAPRLLPDQATLPLIDLLLLKLQRVHFAEKEIQDAIALLLDHRVGDAADKDTIDREYLYHLTNRNWGLWTTVFDNTVTLEKILDRYVDPEEAQLIWRRIELIQEVMDGKGKSLVWWLRAIPNRHFKWYRTSCD